MTHDEFKDAIYKVTVTAAVDSAYFGSTPNRQRTDFWANEFSGVLAMGYFRSIEEATFSITSFIVGTCMVNWEQAEALAESLTTSLVEGGFYDGWLDLD